MKLVVTIFVLSLPNGCFFNKSKEPDSRSNWTIIFPKDRAPIERIIGGEIVVSRNDYPFQVALWFSKHFICGGTLISPTRVLTAAHCIHEFKVKNAIDRITVVMGHVVLKGTATKPSTIAMSAVDCTIHEDYHNGIYNVVNDIALLRLRKPVASSRYINTVAYAQGNYSYANTTGTALGWGKTEDYERSYLLKKSNGTILSNEECRRSLPVNIVPGQICLSNEDDIGASFGDSGGPLLVNDVQVGIVSFGIMYKQKSYIKKGPTVYVRVSYYHDWIARHSGGSTLHEDFHCSNIICLVHLYIIIF